MPYSFTDRLKHAWSAFTSRDPTFDSFTAYGNSYIPTSGYRTRYYGDQSIITMVENRIAVDASQVNIRHVRTDKLGNFQEEMKTGLNYALSVSANIDQTGRNFIQDAVMSMFDEGHVALVPTKTDYSPLDGGQWDVIEMRTGKVLDWYPKHVRVEVFNDLKARREDFVLPKSAVAIIENPFYSIMNEPNSTMKRLIRTLRHLDLVNESNVSGKMDLIIQLPYSLRSPVKQQQAEGRRKQIERQLINSKYGIAYIDAAERITQLNRPVDNNLWQEAQDLTKMLFNQLGLTQSVFDGTADEKVMNNYYNRTIEPIMTSITEEMGRKFLSKTARSRNQKVIYIRDPFKILTINQLADTANTFITDQIMSANEIRPKLGLPPSDSPQADELVNPNINKWADTAQLQDNKNQNETELEKENDAE